MNIKTLIFQHIRAKKSLLVLLLDSDNAQLSLWQQQESVWQEEQDARELEAWLRDVLLAHDVEEGVAMLIVLDDSLLQAEQLTLPRLTPKQLEKTLAWEAAQLFNFPQGSYSFCYKILAANAEAMGQKERATGQQETEQQVIQLWALAYARQSEYRALTQRLMVKLEGLCVGAAAKQLQSRQLEVSEKEVHDDDTLAKAVAQSWFAGEALLLLPAVRKRINWQQCRSRCEQHLPQAAKGMLACACLVFMCVFGLRYLAQSDLEDVEQQAAHYAVWQQRQKESAALEKQVASLKQQSQTRKPQSQVSKELEQWGRLGLKKIYLTELEYKSLSKQSKQASLTVAQGVAGDVEALDILLEQLQANKYYSSVQLVESKQQSGGVGFKLQLSGGQQ